MLTPPNAPNSLNDNHNHQPQRGFRAPWVLILPLALAAGVLVQQSQDTTTTNTATNSVANTAVPAQNTKAPDDKLRGAPAKYTLFSPDDNGDLKRETFVDESWRVTENDFAADAKKVRAEATTRAVKVLMERHSTEFPTGAQLLDTATIDENDRTLLNFNSAFTQASFWQGSARTLSTVYALVNTAIESQKTVTGESGKSEVRFQVEGRPVLTLGELDTSTPLAPDMKMVKTS